MFIAKKGPVCYCNQALLKLERLSNFQSTDSIIFDISFLRTRGLASNNLFRNLSTSKIIRHFA